MTKMSELKGKDDEGLKVELERLTREHFGLRMQFGSGQLGQTHLLKEIRRDIARVKTCLKECRNG